MNFNYHLSRARRMVENVLGVIASRFRIFLSPMSISPKTPEKVVLANCVLHNHLRTKIQLTYTPNASFEKVHSENEAVQSG